jgi:hypothetical protein
MAQQATVLNAALQTALNENYNNRAVMAPIQGPAAVANIPANRATSSIHVPFNTSNGGNYTEDSRITITTLLNQWDVYTKDHTGGATAGGILSGYNANGNGGLNMNAHLFAVIFGGAQAAYNALDDIRTASQAAAAPIIPGHFIQELRLFANFANPIAGAAAPAGAPVDFTGGWSELLNRISEFFPENQRSCTAGEVFAPPANVNTAPVVTTAASAAGDLIAKPPGDLIRYAFGLLYKIKRVLGTDWPDTHNQLSKGGRNSKNNKRNKYTHRKKQYSQRRYKK